MFKPALHALLEAHRGFEMRCVVTREDWARVRELRYDAMLADGDIAASPERSVADAHDRETDSATFLLTREGRAAGTIRANMSSPGRFGALPSMGVVAREIRASIGAQCTAVEASLMAVDPGSKVDRRVALFHLLKGPMLLCALVNADWLLCAVRETQIGFYRRMLNMEILSGAEHFPGMDASRVLMGLQYHEHSALLFKRLPVLAVSRADQLEYANTGCIPFAEHAHRQQAA
jgi:hypothetical protein